MKEINGTITLAYVEEDNRQRIIFRVIPLCTKEGYAYQDKETFADEGSLRIVPDKREQSTFKERMRNIGGLCTINLQNDGKEISKVRPNRNYAPEHGEKNKLAIYSDVLYAFEEKQCFEVLAYPVSSSLDISSVLTEYVLLQKDKVLLGPVEKSKVFSENVDELKPFGNDSFILQHISHYYLGTHDIYWNPERIVTWRQYKQSLRQKERIENSESNSSEKLQEKEDGVETNKLEKGRFSKEKVAPVKAGKMHQSIEKDNQATASSDTPVEKSAVKATEITEKKKVDVEVADKKVAQAVISSETNVSEVSETTEVNEVSEAQNNNKIVEDNKAPEKNSENNFSEDATSEDESVLPIGEKLNILDQEISFENQLSRLSQPLEQLTNRLDTTTVQTVEREEVKEAPARVFGTPLVSIPHTIEKSTSEPIPVEKVVAKKMEKYQDDVVKNPVDELIQLIWNIWDCEETRVKAIKTLAKNDRFMSDIQRYLSRNGRDTQAIKAAQEQLIEVEAERISVLMQVEMAVNQEKAYRENALKKVQQKKREEINRLTKEVEKLKTLKSELTKQTRKLSDSNAESLKKYIAHELKSAVTVEDQTLTISPVLGKDYDRTTLAKALRTHMNRQGYDLNDDASLNVLLNFALNDVIVFKAHTISEGVRFSETLLSAFGLQSLYAVLDEETRVVISSLLPDEPQRTPTVTLQRFGTPIIRTFGHKAICVTVDDEISGMNELNKAYPIIQVPRYKTVSITAHNNQEFIFEPSSLKSFFDIKDEKSALNEEMEKWCDELFKTLATHNISLPGGTDMAFREFMKVAAQKFHGGFLLAADYAIMTYIIPYIDRKHSSLEEINNLLIQMPKSNRMLNS